MAEQALQYGLQVVEHGTRLGRVYANLPQVVIGQIEASDKLKAELDDLTDGRRRIFERRPLKGGGAQLLLTTRVINELEPGTERTVMTRRAVQMFNYVQRIAAHNKVLDPSVNFVMEPRPVIGTNTFATRYEAAWPELPDATITHVAGVAVASMAYGLGVQNMSPRPKDFDPTRLAAIERRGRGLALRLDTNGDSTVKSYFNYRPDAPTVTFAGDRITTHEQQLSGFAATIAIAHAEDLIKSGLRLPV